MTKENTIPGNRPPIVAVVGHIDHGKSTLLDYIRNTNVVAGEAGGITQHLSAYEATHENATGVHNITFLDTPGHAAFRAMRSRGLEVADVAILVVSAEEGVKPQTLEALQLINDVKIPYIVALTKIDKPGANVDRAKMSLSEHGIFVEGYGGEVPWVAVSGKTGEGIPELLDLILLAAELEGLSADPSLPGQGLIIEAHVDPKRGNTATLIVQDGTVRAGEFVVSGESMAPVRIMENFLGKPTKEALPGSPVRIVGFSSLPAVGAHWKTLETKKEAEEEAAQARRTGSKHSGAAALTHNEDEEKLHVMLPILIKTDFAGTGDAVLHEIEKLPKDEKLEVRVILTGVGAITESDVRLVGAGSTPGLILGFNVKVEKEAREAAERMGVEIGSFDIIYKLTEWLEAELEKRRPREHVEEKTGLAKVLKFFSAAKGRVILGGRVEEGSLKLGDKVKIMRRDLVLGRGEVVSLQAQKIDTREVSTGEFGAMLKADTEPAPGDYLEAYTVVLK